MAKTFLYTVENFSSSIYKQLSDIKTAYQRRNALRDAAIIELLFAAEMRISKLNSLDVKSVSLYDRTKLIYEKGSKKVQLGDDVVVCTLERYKSDFQTEIQSYSHFFSTSEW